MFRRPPRSTRTDPLFPDTTLFRSDSALDLEIMFALGYRYEQRHIGAFYDDNEPALDWVFVDPVTDKWVSTHPRDFTSSLDDVRALIDPADEWELTTLYGVARAAVGLNRDHQTGWPGYGEHEGGDPVRALLSAALKARSPSHEG